MPPISLVALVLTVIPLFIKKKLDHEKRLREGGSEQNENEE
jgi:hypothetical protein